MAKDIPPSRLNITYRTQVDGRPVQRKLPFRMLVLGDFSGRHAPGGGEPLAMLHERPIHEIGKPLNGKPVTLTSLMKELRLGLPLPSTLTNDAEFDLAGSFEAHALCENDVLRLWFVTTELGRAKASDDEAPSSLGSDRLAIPVHTVDAELHCFDELEFERAPALGEDAWKLKKDARFGGWIEPERDKPGEPRVIFRITSVSALSLVFPAGLPEGQKTNVTGRLRVTARAAQRVPLRNMQSFAPEQLTFATPELRRLMILRWLLAQVRTAVSANPVLRSSLKELMKDKTAIAALREKLVEFDRSVGSPFRIDPETAPSAPKPPPAASAPKPPPGAPAPAPVAAPAE